MLKDYKPQLKTITINGEVMKIRYNMNALDYIERTMGSVDSAFEDETVLGQKHIIRAALLCNYDENKALLDENRLDELKPGLSQVGEWFDLDEMKAVATELYKVAFEQMTVEGEQRPGEQQGENTQILINAIGALCNLFGRPNFIKALRTFGLLPQEK